MNYNNIILPELNSVEDSQIKKKPHVHIACNNCKRAHLACDESRPCKRCRATEKADSCQNTEHKKRGRPKLPKDDTRKTKRLNVMIPELVNSTFSSQKEDEETPTMLTIFITLDLCCARASDESFDFLDLYPQELSHRSIYDFILPGEEVHIGKIHRHLLNNVTHQHQNKIPNNVLRSSSDLFYSTAPKRLMDIANGSQTFKQTIKFRRKEKEQEMNASFYLGGGLGADLLQSESLSQLYIVCVLSPTIPVKKTGIVNLSLLLLNEQQQQQQQQQQQKQERIFEMISSPTQSHYSTSDRSASSPPSEERKDLSQFQKKPSKVNTKQQGAIGHPNELYYFQTTSSRLSSEAIARTTTPYLSGTNLVNTNIQFSPLAKFNNMSGSFL